MLLIPSWTVRFHEIALNPAGKTKSRELNRTWMPWQYMKINFTHLIDQNELLQIRTVSHATARWPQVEKCTGFRYAETNRAFLSYTALILDHYYF